MEEYPVEHKVVEVSIRAGLASFMRGHGMYPMGVWLLFIILVMMVDPVAGSAQPRQRSLIRSRLVAIGEKSGNGIVAGECRFAVNESTVILDILEKKIKLGDLPIPCEAEIQYRLRTDEDPLCVKITVKRLLEGAGEVRPSPGSE